MGPIGGECEAVNVSLPTTCIIDKLPVTMVLHAERLLCSFFSLGPTLPRPKPSDVPIQVAMAKRAIGSAKTTPCARFDRVLETLTARPSRPLDSCKSREVKARL